MRVGIINPYFRETLDILQNCHESVRKQTHACEHFMVADGFPQPEISNWAVLHIVLARSHGAGGATPRSIGSLSAMNQDFEAIAFLDADNWYYANHVDAMIKLHQQTGAAVCTASRTIHRPDGSLMYEDHEYDERNVVDTSCLFFTKQAFRLLPTWAMMPKQFGPICDRIMWNIIRSLGLPCAHHREPTVAFRTHYAFHYNRIGETPPPGAKTDVDLNAWNKWWSALTPEEQADWQRRMSLRR